MDDLSSSSPDGFWSPENIETDGEERDGESGLGRRKSRTPVSDTDLEGGEGSKRQNQHSRDRDEVENLYEPTNTPSRNVGKRTKPKKIRMEETPDTPDLQKIVFKEAYVRVSKGEVENHSGPKGRVLSSVFGKGAARKTSSSSRRPSSPENAKPDSEHSTEGILIGDNKDDIVPEVVPNSPETEPKDVSSPEIRVVTSTLEKECLNCHVWFNSSKQLRKHDCFPLTGTKSRPSSSAEAREFSSATKKQGSNTEFGKNQNAAKSKTSLPQEIETSCSSSTGASKSKQTEGTEKHRLKEVKKEQDPDHVCPVRHCRDKESSSLKAGLYIPPDNRFFFPIPKI